MDMYDNYREIIKRRLKDATIVIDSFHVMKHINEALDEVRLKVMRRFAENERSDEYYLLKHKKYVLFKEGLSEELEHNSHFRLKMNEEDYLSRILKIDKDLTNAYQLAKRYYYFNHYWNEYNEEEALKYIDSFIDECFKLNLPSFEKLANTLDNWKKEIANSFIPYIRNNGEKMRLSNGKIEGKNSYIKKMIRLANGYSNFERFRNRAMYCENRYEKYSKEPIKHKVKRQFPKKKKKKK
jgi:transposase